LAALHHRDQTGQGQAIEVNLLSSLLSALTNQASGFVSGGHVPGIMGNAHPSITPYDVYQAADRPIVIAVGNDGQFAKLCEVLGIPDVPADTRFVDNTTRVAHRSELNDLLGPAIASRAADDLWQALTDAGVPSGPINTFDQAFALAESLDLKPIIEQEVDGQLRRQVANPISFSATPVEYRMPPPDLQD
jgi:crotonobetainyl-CoA:carnitine CoA-transferase CaiB-like acyl-CoA transferase